MPLAGKHEHLAVSRRSRHPWSGCHPSWVVFVRPGHLRLVWKHTKLILAPLFLSLANDNLATLDFATTSFGDSEVRATFAAVSSGRTKKRAITLNLKDEYQLLNGGNGPCSALSSNAFAIYAQKLGSGKDKGILVLSPGSKSQFFRLDQIPYELAFTEGGTKLAVFNQEPSTGRSDQLISLQDGLRKMLPCGTLSITAKHALVARDGDLQVISLKNRPSGELDKKYKAIVAHRTLWMKRAGRSETNLLDNAFALYVQPEVLYEQKTEFNDSYGSKVNSALWGPTGLAWTWTTKFGIEGPFRAGKNRLVFYASSAVRMGVPGKTRDYIPGTDELDTRYWAVKEYPAAFATEVRRLEGFSLVDAH